MSQACPKQIEISICSEQADSFTKLREVKLIALKSQPLNMACRQAFAMLL